ncbi:MAG: integrase [Aquabacterium sp.]|nr:MAG: integrase [Aquabacterium sp.]
MSAIVPVQPALRLAAPVPLEALVLADELSGLHGTNRSRAGRCQLAATTDREAVLAWLHRYADSPNTLANARKEAERLMLWSLAELGKPLSSLTNEDLQLYQHFLSDPQPQERWVMAPGRKLPRQHPGWRPFAGPLSPASQRQAMLVLNSLLTWLVEAGYLAGNPLALSRRRRRHAAPQVERFLPDDVWAEVRATIVAMPRSTTREAAAAARARWLFSLFYLCGLRISEVSGNTMGGFFSRIDKTGETRWWLELTGKGDKMRLVPATAELMVELTNYRRALDLPALPQPGEPAPLLFPVCWQAVPRARGAVSWPAPLTRSAIHGLVKDVFAQTAARLRAVGADREAQAVRLEAASSHWLRHTMGSRLADGVDLRHVRDTLGHASIATTSIYLHGEDDARHAAVSAAHRLDWDLAQPQAMQS